MNRARKNYGGRMIFGDEKLTPLRSVPRCALAFGSGRLTGGYTVRGSARPSPKLLPSVATSHTRKTLCSIMVEMDKRVLSIYV